MIDIGGAAETLYQARAAGVRCDPFDLDIISNIETAYAICDAANARCGSTLKVWKAGATGKATWPILKAKEPFYATIPASFCHNDGATVPTPLGLLGIECEYAFLLRQDLPVHKAPFTAEDVKMAIAAGFPAIEIVGLGQDVSGIEHVGRLIADFGGNVAFINGAMHTDWEKFDIVNTPVSAIINGETKVTGSGAAVLDDPLEALAWMATKAASRGRGLHEGQWATTGSTVGIVPAARGDKISGDFGELGSVSVTLG